MGLEKLRNKFISSLEVINRKVFCFIDDNIKKQNKTLFGKKLYHKILLKIC